MAFTPSEKQQIRQFLGFSELFHDIDTRLETQLIRIGDAADQSAKERVSTLVVSLNDIDTRLVGALDNLTLEKAEDVTFRGEQELEGLRKQGRMFIQQLSILFEVRPMRDYFGMEISMGGFIPQG